MSDNKTEVKEDKQKLLSKDNKDVKAAEKPKEVASSNQKSFFQEFLTPHILIGNLSI